jgi:hypothetical protein
MFEHDGSRTGTDFSMIDGNGTPRASYRHMEFIAKYFSGNYADGRSTSENIKVFGARDDSKVSVMIINREGGSQTYTLRLDDASIDGKGLKLNVQAGIDKEYSDIIPEASTQVLMFRGNEITRWVYSADDFLNDRPPVKLTVTTGD